MARKKIPATPCIRALEAAGADYEAHPYAYEPKGVARAAARALCVNAHAVVMHGDLEVSLKALARHLGARGVSPADAGTAERLTGYRVGGITPLGARQALPVYAQASIFALERIYINGGRRGLMVALDPAELERLLPVTRVDAAARA
jgi:prolyl-tRNA editing enzyme YbaK/EbsC (Cys-tRNA(Pro) deacylase)